MLTVNGNPALACRLTWPLTGRWTATVELSADETVSGAATVKWDDRDMAVGHVVRAAERAGVVRAFLVGGAGGLSGTVGASHYRQVTARTIVGDILAETGEALDTTSTRSSLDTQIAFWSRVEGPATEALVHVCDISAANWRATPSGKIWIGVDEWPEVEDFEALDLDDDGALGTRVFACEDPRLIAGATFRGLRLQRVEHEFTRDASLRTTVWL